MSSWSAGATWNAGLTRSARLARNAGVGICSTEVDPFDVEGSGACNVTRGQSPVISSEDEKSSRQQSGGAKRSFDSGHNRSSFKMAEERELQTISVSDRQGHETQAAFAPDGQRGSQQVPARQPFGIDSFVLKLIAIVAMTANHAAYIFDAVLPAPALFVMYTVGGLTFPIMAFLLVVGYKHTSNVRKYMLRLALFAAVSQVPFQLFLAPEGNVLITLLLSLVALYLYDTLQSRVAFWLAFAGIVAISSVCDWAMIGPVMVLMMYVLPTKTQQVAYPILLVMAASGFPALMEAMAKNDVMMVPFALYAFIGCGADIPLLLAYNGKRGRSLKWFFYAYYPLHIAILGIAKLALVG